MIDKFKTFLQGAPYRLNEDTTEGWAYQVAVILPSVLRKWYDVDFGNDVWAKEGSYYETARLKLAGLAAFQQKCSEAGETLQMLKMLMDFFANEKRKKGLGKTARKAGGGRGATALPGGGGAAPRIAPASQLASLGGYGVRAIPTGRAGSMNPPLIEELTEGKVVEMHFAKHERNPALRKACIEHFRVQNNGRIACAACGMAFGEMYGAFGEGYIEVHHLSPISQTEDVHTVDPKIDLVPLCANCHAMIHRLMAAEKKSTGVNLEGNAALEKLKNSLNVWLPNPSR